MYVAGILLQDPKSMDGVKVLGTAEWKSPQQILDDLSRESGQEVKFEQVSPEAFSERLPKHFAAALTANMVWMRDYGYYGPGAEETQLESHKILSGLKPKSWREFVRQNGPWEWSA